MVLAIMPFQTAGSPCHTARTDFRTHTGCSSCRAMMVGAVKPTDISTRRDISLVQNLVLSRSCSFGNDTQAVGCLVTASSTQGISVGGPALV